MIIEYFELLIVNLCLKQFQKCAGECNFQRMLIIDNIMTEFLRKIIITGHLWLPTFDFIQLPKKRRRIFFSGKHFTCPQVSCSLFFKEPANISFIKLMPKNSALLTNCKQPMGISAIHRKNIDGYQLLVSYSYQKI